MNSFEQVGGIDVVRNFVASQRAHLESEMSPEAHMTHGPMKELLQNLYPEPGSLAALSLEETSS
jgi:hypothetical protein